jgi:hypothetical protein
MTRPYRENLLELLVESRNPTNDLYYAMDLAKAYLAAVEASKPMSPAQTANIGAFCFQNARHEFATKSTDSRQELNRGDQHFSN